MVKPGRYSDPFTIAQNTSRHIPVDGGATHSVTAKSITPDPQAAVGFQGNRMIFACLYCRPIVVAANTYRMIPLELPCPVSQLTIMVIAPSPQAAVGF